MERVSAGGGAGAGKAEEADVIINTERLSRAIEENIEIFNYFLREKKCDIFFSKISADLLREMDGVFKHAFADDEVQYEKLLFFIVGMARASSAIREFASRISSPQLLFCKVAELVNSENLDLDCDKDNGGLFMEKLFDDADIQRELIRQYNDLTRDVTISEEDKFMAFEASQSSTSHYCRTIDHVSQFQEYTVDPDVPEDFELSLTDLSGITKPDGEIIYEFRDNKITNRSLRIYNPDNIYIFYDYNLKRLRSISLSQISDAASYEHFLSPSSPKTEDSYADIVRSLVARYRMKKEDEEKLIAQLTASKPFTAGMASHMRFCDIIDPYCVDTTSEDAMSGEEKKRKESLRNALLYGLVGDVVFRYPLELVLTEGRSLAVFAIIPPKSADEKALVAKAEILPDIALTRFYGLNFAIPPASRNVINLFIDNAIAADQRGFRQFLQWLEDAKVEYLKAKRAIAQSPEPARPERTEQELNSALFALRKLFSREAKSIPMSFRKIDPIRSINILDKDLLRALSDENFGKAISFNKGGLRLVANHDIIEGVEKLGKSLSEYKKTVVTDISAGGAGAGTSATIPAKAKADPKPVAVIKTETSPTADELRRQAIEAMKQKKEVEQREKERLAKLESDKAKEESDRQKNLLSRVKAELEKHGVSAPKSGSNVNVRDGRFVMSLRENPWAADLFKIGKSNTSFAIKTKLSEAAVIELEKFHYERPKGRVAPIVDAAEEIAVSTEEGAAGAGSGTAYSETSSAAASDDSVADVSFTTAMADLIKKGNASVGDRIKNISQTMDFVIQKSMALGNLYLQGGNIWMQDPSQLPKDVDLQLFLSPENEALVKAGAINEEWLVENIFNNKINPDDILQVMPIYGDYRTTRKNIVAYSIKLESMDLIITTKEYEEMKDNWVCGSDSKRFCFNTGKIEDKISFANYLKEARIHQFMPFDPRFDPIIDSTNKALLAEEKYGHLVILMIHQFTSD